MNKEIIQKYFRNQCSEEEFEILSQWIREEALDKEEKNRQFENWKSFEPEIDKNDEKYSLLLDKIHHQINLNQNSCNKSWRIGKVSSWLTHAAAVLFIPLLGVLLYMFSNNHLTFDNYTAQAVDTIEVIAPIGSRTVVQLADGTEVNLNYGSKIKYPRTFHGHSREITLSGEAYFDVAHNPDKPFIVKTGKINVTALGTEFNVQAYADDEAVATTLVEGKVLIEKVLAKQAPQKLGFLVPGQHVNYNLKSGEIYSTKGDVDKYTAWKDGKLVFDNESISVVAQKLSRMFNVDIEIAENVKHYTYTVTFINDPLYLILDLMSETTPVKYKIFPRTKMADGTYSKQKIRIEKKE
ncbi:FecR domain-containing protein [uncultured Draconibacterium sp.]|uniref:FecR family protein n=1 Tax=uncultured Draconibacterium sp. TaxID=1573823 RepID=UPI003261201D